MSHSRVLLAFLLATSCLLAGSIANAQVGIEPVADQTIPSGKTLVVPIPASDPGGPARTYTVTIGTPTVSGTTTPATNAGITAAIRTGDPHLIMGVSYSDSNAVTMSSTTPIITTGTMEFQLLREFTPQTSSIIAGLTQGGFYSPAVVDGTNTYVKFHRVVQGGIIQAGDPLTRGTNSVVWGNGGPGFSFPNEYHPALIFSGSAGQLAMANSGNGIVSGTTFASGTIPITTGTVTTTGTSYTTIPNSARNGTNGCQFFVTLSNPRHLGYDFSYTLFGQLVRGWDTLFGIGATPVEDNGKTGAAEEISLPDTPVDITSATVTQNNTDAVLLLSATGVCDAQVTIIATTVGGGTVTTATTSFIAHAVADTTNDSPFIQPSPPDIAAANGTVKVPISATDLEFELLAYGYERILPVLDPTITSGTSPILSVPLLSNTANTVAATAAHWNSDGTTESVRVFHAGAGSKALTGKLATIPAGSGHLDLGASPPLAVITDPNPGDVAASFTATVIWGDGTAPNVTGTSGSGSPITITKAAAGRFNVIIPHDYAAPGQFPIIVRINNTLGDYLTLSGTANVAPSALTMAGYDFTSKGGILKNQLLATFTDNGNTSTPSDYTTLVNWGDGAVTSGTVRSLGHSSFQLLGTHTYLTPDQFTVAATVTRTGTYSASTWTTASVTGVTAPQVFPPFPQIHLGQMWTVLYSDSTNVLTSGSDGGSPYSGLVQGSDGNFYGTTAYGGANAYGTVYQLSSTGSFTTLHSFTGGADGGNPFGPVVEDGTSDTYYGTTYQGGANGAGTIYSITSSGSFSTVYTFNPGADGGFPTAGLVANGTSAFYGTTGTDGANGGGTVFQVTTTGGYSPIYSFTGGSDGSDPAGGVITGTDGNLYGTTESGGSSGVGTVFELTPSGSISTLHTFLSGTDGANPAAGLVQGLDGNFYGTTMNGGNQSNGTIFQISYSGSYNSIYSFDGEFGDGTSPQAPLIAGTNGLLYGTTTFGGANGDGIVYQASYQGAETILYQFSNAADGGTPYAPVIVGADDGLLYGTTETGGTAGYGTVYQLTVGSSSVNTIHTFGSGRASQIALRGAVNIVNSGSKPLLTGSGTFSVYVDAADSLDGNQTPFTYKGQTVINLPALQPGQSTSYQFQLQGSFSDTRLKLPLNFDPAGQSIIGVVTYSDPVGNYDGAVKIVTPGSF